jgi:hypothetical protein
MAITNSFKYVNVCYIVLLKHCLVRFHFQKILLLILIVKY